MEEIFGPRSLTPFLKLMRDEFKYDVAFSFVQRDEQLALQMADRIRDRVSVFLYSERQEVFAGTDGVDQHSRIYEDEARVVVILYREEWGRTGWTRVEETAIRNRGFKEGYDYLVFVPLDDSAKPKWLPITRIWVGFERYGVDGVAGAIEATVYSEGGAVRFESVADYAARVTRELNFKSERVEWLGSSQGIASARQEVNNLFGELGRLAEEVNSRSPGMRLSFRVDSRSVCNLLCKCFNLQFVWKLEYLNSLRDSMLYVRIFEAYGLGNYRVLQGGPRVIHNVQYDVDLELGLRVGWRETDGQKSFITTALLAELWLKNLLDCILTLKCSDEELHEYGTF